MSTPLPASPERRRLSLDLSPQVDQLLDHVAGVLGLTRAQVASHALTEALPALLERSDAFQKRARELSQAAQQQQQVGKKR